AAPRRRAGSIPPPRSRDRRACPPASAGRALRLRQRTPASLPNPTVAPRASPAPLRTCDGIAGCACGKQNIGSQPSGLPPRDALSLRMSGGVSLGMLGRGVASLVVLSVLASALAGCKPENKFVAPPPPEISVAAPLQQKITPFIELTGN